MRDTVKKERTGTLHVSSRRNRPPRQNTPRSAKKSAAKTKNAGDHPAPTPELEIAARAMAPSPSGMAIR